MSIQTIEKTTTTSQELFIRNRNTLLSIGILIFLVLTYGTLISLLLYVLSDIQNHWSGSLWSIVTNTICAVIFTNVLFYFSLYTTRVSRTEDRLRICSFGLFPVVSITDVRQEEVQDIIITKIENPFTANYSVTVTFFLKDKKRKANTFSLPRESIGDSLETVKRVLGMRSDGDGAAP